MTHSGSKMRKDTATPSSVFSVEGGVSLVEYALLSGVLALLLLISIQQLGLRGVTQPLNSVSSSLMRGPKSSGGIRVALDPAVVGEDGTTLLDPNQGEGGN